jgi:O-succinylbenzoic acid--CoA ligase
MERSDLAGRLASLRTSGRSPGGVVDAAEPARFMSVFADAVSGDKNVFLASSAWPARERAELDRLAALQGGGDKGWLMIPSGGSGGGLKFARHDGRTIAAAVSGFCRHFGMERVNSVGVLPLHHVSGFMAWMRSALTGGVFLPWSWKEAEAGNFPKEVPPDCCLSLVPTQLQRLIALENGPAWLRKFRVIFVGGGPAWQGLIEEAGRLGLPLSICYGSTETAAMVAALKPDQFLSGIRGCGAALPHASIEIVDGVVRVTGESVFRGYFPAHLDGRSWTSDDLGSFEAGSLVIHGRRDDVIVTGGKKVSPQEVEEALMASGEFEDVAVFGLPDPEWGQVVVAFHPPTARPPRKEIVSAALSGLEPHKHPKRYAIVSPWPRSPQGKVDRKLLAKGASGA